MTVNYRGICCITLTPGQNLVRVFNSISGCEHAMCLHCHETKLPNLKVKTRPKQLLGPLPLDIAHLCIRYNFSKVFSSQTLHFSRSCLF